VIMQVPKILFLALVSHAFLKSASAELQIYKDKKLWQARVEALAGPPCTSKDDFSGDDIPLAPGITDVGLFNVTVDALPVGGTELGQIGGQFVGWIASTGPTVLVFNGFDNAPVVAVAAYWLSTTNANKLKLDVCPGGANGCHPVNFSAELGNPPGGDGFLGFVDEAHGITSMRFNTENPTSHEGELFYLDKFWAAGECPPDCENGGSGCQGDPHFKTWRGQHFDYHGECDLVLIKSDQFESGLGLDVHIRTKIRRHMSYIASAALRIGKDILEVESQGVYWLNGVLNAVLPAEFSGFAFSHTQPTDKQHVFEVHLGGRERIKVKTYKDFVSVLIEKGQSKHFHDSAGLMGDFRMGHMIARNGKTVIDDVNAFGQEWQVLDTEPSLFHTVRLPQHPQQVCTLPPPMEASQLRRRLEESSPISERAAEEACEHWGEGKDDCVFDVLTTGDLDMAVVGAY
jgi:hypothetical protein